MQKDNPLFDDMAKLASGAAGAVLDMRREIQAMVADHLRGLMERMDLVERSEFERVKIMAEKAREENEALKARLDALEAAARATGKKSK